MVFKKYNFLVSCFNFLNLYIILKYLFMITILFNHNAANGLKHKSKYLLQSKPSSSYLLSAVEGLSPNQSAHSQLKRSNASSSMDSIKKNNYKITALVDKSVTLTCSIDLDDKNFFKSGNYKILWSKDSDNGKDYEPLALDDNRLISNQRITASRYLINKQTFEQIQWTLVISNLKLADSGNYICQLNRKPYDVYWLRRFQLNVYEPAAFLENNDSADTNSSSEYENSIFIKSINEFDDFKLKCLAKGRPKPTVSWYLKYQNGSSIQLDVDNNEIVIKNIRRTSKLDRIECQVSNGFGASVSRTFKINIKHVPYIMSKSKVYRVPARTNEVKLNCSMISNPLGTIQWLFMPNEKIEADTTISNLDDLHSQWRSINSIASYSLKQPSLNPNNINYYLNSSFIKLPLSKYQIHEKHISFNQMYSVLVIRLINDKDFGIYRCFASNELGNKTNDFRLEELNYESLNSEKMRSLIQESKINDSKEITTKSKSEKKDEDETSDNLTSEDVYNMGSLINSYNNLTVFVFNLIAIFYLF